MGEFESQQKEGSVRGYDHQLWSSDCLHSFIEAVAYGLVILCNTTAY